MKSAFPPEEQGRLVAAWKSSGLTAAKFSGRHPGLTASLLHNWNWRKKLVQSRRAEPRVTGPSTVRLAVELDIATYAPLARAAADLSLAKGIHVTIEEYAEATLRHLLTGASKTGKIGKAGNPQKEIDGTQEGSRRGPKGRRPSARRGAGGNVAGGATQGTGLAVRKGQGRSKGAGTASGGPPRHGRHCTGAGCLCPERS